MKMDLKGKMVVCRKYLKFQHHKRREAARCGNMKAYKHFTTLIDANMRRLNHLRYQAEMAEIKKRKK